MNFTAIVILVAVGLFAGTSRMLEIGRYLGRRAEEEGPRRHTAAVTVEAAVFALLGLVIALTFSGRSRVSIPGAGCRAWRPTRSARRG